MTKNLARPGPNHFFLESNTCRMRAPGYEYQDNENKLHLRVGLSLRSRQLIILRFLDPHTNIYKKLLSRAKRETYSQMQFIFIVLALIPTVPHSTCTQIQKKVVREGPVRSGAGFLSPISSQTAKNIKKLKIQYESS